MKEIKNIFAIDMHSHINSGASFDTKIHELYRADLSFFLEEEYPNAKIACGAFSTFGAVLYGSEKDPGNIFAQNEYMLKVAEEKKQVFQWVVLDPRQEKLYGQVKEHLQSSKAIGIKIHSVCHSYPFLDYADKVFSFAEKCGVPIMMHPELGNVEKIAKIADNYPGVSFIIAHIGSMEQINAIKNAKHQNVYTDTSGNASSMNNVIEYAYECIGANRILFGTDTYSSAFQRGRIEYARIPYQAKEDILRNNALKLFPKIKKFYDNL